MKNKKKNEIKIIQEQIMKIKTKKLKIKDFYLSIKSKVGQLKDSIKIYFLQNLCCVDRSTKK